jgi:transposase
MSKQLQELKPIIQNCYVNQLMEVGELSKRYNISKTIIYRWVKQGSWREKREKKGDLKRRTPEILLDDLQAILNTIKQAREYLEIKGSQQTTLDDMKQSLSIITKCSDAVSKITKSIRTTFRDLDRLDSILFAFGEFRIYVADEQKKKGYDEEFYEKLDKLLEGFQDEVIKKFSPKNMS